MAKRTIVKRNFEGEHITLEEAFAEFLVEKEALNCAPSTIRNYKQSYNKFMEFNGFTPNTPVTAVAKTHFYDWVYEMKKGEMKPVTINHYLRDCRTFFYWCMDIDKQYLPKPFKIKMVSYQEETIKVFTDEELKLLLEKPRRDDSFTTWRTWVMVNWVLATGNRAGTICEVKLKDVHFSSGEIVLAHTKNKKAQIIPLSSTLEGVIKEYLRMWRNGAHREEYLFCDISAEQLTRNALSHSFYKYCKARGVSKTSIHGLRHNFAKGWVQNNGNIYTLQSIMGHSTLDMTRRYVRLFSEDLKKDYDKFSPLDTMKRKAHRTHAVHRSI